jgi:YidC/Oxa1 family membrane protein insertase
VADRALQPLEPRRSRPPVIVAGILTPIEDVLTWLLEHLHTDLALTWAWSVVALTVIVRVLLVPVMVRQVHSMQNMQRHAPEMKEIQKKYKHDRRKQNEELMKFYKENNINPASSCLPIVFQIPIFFALYFVLRDFDKEVYPDYPESTLGWLGFVPDITKGITDHWSGILLLSIYILSQVASGYFMSVSAQRSQRIMMMVIPFVILPFLLDPPGGTIFPVGLLIYWMTTNLWTIGQGLITRRTTPKAPPAGARGPKRSSRTPPKLSTDGDEPREAPEAREAPPAAEPGPPVRKKRKKKKGARR